MDRFAICQAFAQLEADYNVGGWLHERPSNQRRMESIGVQLHRMGYANPYGYTEICAEQPDGSWGELDSFDEKVRQVYVEHVLRWGLPMDDALKALARRLFVPEYLAQFSAFKE